MAEKVNPNRRLSRRLYREGLRLGRRQAGSGGLVWRGYWSADPRIAPRDLAAALDRALDDPRAVILKRGPHAFVVQTFLYGREVVIKRHDPAGCKRALKDLPRPSRARKAWAAARALEILGLPAIPPLGFIERRRHGWPDGSAFIMQARPGAVHVKQALREQYTALDATARETWRRALAGGLLTLYRHGIRHDDAKASNLLLTVPPGGRGLCLLWIDCEGLRCTGRRPRRGSVLRNLAQLNGSLAAIVPVRERLRFLKEFRTTCPGLLPARAARRIARRTEQRLRREVRP